MKLTKKKLFVAAVALSLVAIISAGTLAWFQASDEVTNKFLIADSDQDGTPDFSIDVWENDPEDPTVKDTDGVVYPHIAPGDVLAKNPTVENTGDYDQWVRVYVTFDEWSKINAACAAQGITNDLRTWLNVNYGLATPAWTAVGDGVVDGDSVTYVYYYNYKLAADQTAVLFTNVTIPGEFEQADMTYASGDFSINVKAEAIQADNTGDNAYDAFAAYWGK